MRITYLSAPLVFRPIAAGVSILAGLNLCATVYAQSQDEDAPLEPVTIEERYTDTVDTEEESYDDLVMDDQTGSYRLVQDETEDDWVEPASQAELEMLELVRLFELYREALANKDYLEADTLAKRVVELSIRINGIDSHDSAKSLTNLGIAQHHNEDYESALLNFQASIDIVERIEDRLSSALINPLQGLATTQAAMGRPDLARRSFQRAVHVSHVNDGPHNPDQIESLEAMAELDIAMGEFSRANDMQESIWSIQSRKLDPGSLEILPALYKKAEWQHRLQRYGNERLTWRQVIRVIEKQKGKNHLDLIQPLQNLGKSYLYVTPAEFDFQQEVSASSGESHMRRANRIATTNPDATWETVEGSLLALGDFYVLSGRPNRAARIYLETWDLLSEEEFPERLGNRRENLEKPRLLQDVFPPKYYNSARDDQAQTAPENFEEGTVTIKYKVQPTGRITELVHIETQPAEIKDFYPTVGRSLRRLIYRPRLEDRELVATPEMFYTHEFFYRPSDLKKLQEAEAAAEAEANGDQDPVE